MTTLFSTPHAKPDLSELRQRAGARDWMTSQQVAQMIGWPTDVDSTNSLGIFLHKAGHAKLKVKWRGAPRWVWSTTPGVPRGEAAELRKMARECLDEARNRSPVTRRAPVTSSCYPKMLYKTTG